MKEFNSKHSAKEIRFHLLLLVGTCLLFAMFLPMPRAFNVRNLWKMQVPSENHRDATSTSTETSIDPDIGNNNARTNGTLDHLSQKNGGTVLSKPICDFSDWRSNICNMTGDIRTKGYNSSTVYYIPSVRTLVPKEQEWIINPYSQKMFTYSVNLVTVRQLQYQHDAPSCTVCTSIPAILLSMGGPSAGGNIWHAFNDVLIPLFLASKPLNGEVQFLASSYNQGLINKYIMILKDLTRYEIINFDEDKEVRCYPHVTVGLLNHRDFSIDPDRAFDRFDMFKFRLYVRNIYSLPMNVDIPYKMDNQLEKKPRLLIILRSKSRKLLNLQEVADVITKTGFEHVQMEPKKADNVTDLARLVDSCDVIMGVHGAGLTNMLFLRTNAVMIQVIPLGGKHMNGAAHGYLERPAQDMKLRTLNYTITVEESSLLDKYGRDHLALKDPEAIAAKGWQDPQRYYWFEQDVRLNLTRFQSVLVKALELLNE